MSNPSTDATPGANTGEALSFDQQVAQLASTVTRGDDGKYQFPEDASVELKTATRAELRRRDTQAAFTQTSQKAKSLEAENKRLKDLLSKRNPIQLTAEQKDELEELKSEDPDAWRAKLNEYEQAANQRLNQELEEVSTSASSEGELARRQLILDQFLEDNPGLKIDDDVIANDVPPRITKQLENGDITFEKFLDEVKGYLTTSRKVAGSVPGEETKEVNLSSTGGGSNASKTAVSEDIVTSYQNELY